MSEDTQLGAIFPDLERQLTGLSAQMLSAESHGMLCARFCVEAHPDFDVWIDEVLGDESQTSGRHSNLLVKEAMANLYIIYEMTSGMFDNLISDFALLLPPDSDDLSTRGQALAEWCEGFVVGLGLSGIRDEDRYGDDMREMMRDLIEISHLDSEMETNEENEMTFLELVEYVRVGVMTIEMELRSHSEARTLH
ncbi:MAG: hypothetical protein EP297_13135 [Gammaproteobacteria bacterium]|nr:MAG: hypothetical protein EP297_13135 [Gammaproteobacteria bacterium]